MITIEDIVAIKKSDGKSGYDIVFRDGRIIWLTKRRTIPALLLLIKYGEGCETDLTAASDRLPAVIGALKGKMPDNIIRSSYGDANKPFSELWNEEGFTFITNDPGDKRLGSQRYVLDYNLHDLLFSKVKKAIRRAPTTAMRAAIANLQGPHCNICGSALLPRKNINREMFSKDRMRLVYDHRVPIEKGGSSVAANYQALCFYCNKSKWQVCDRCDVDGCDRHCALAFPEVSNVIAPTGENIADRMKRIAAG